MKFRVERLICHNDSLIAINTIGGQYENVNVVDQVETWKDDLEISELDRIVELRWVATVFFGERNLLSVEDVNKL